MPVLRSRAVPELSWRCPRMELRVVSSCKRGTSEVLCLAQSVIESLRQGVGLDLPARARQLILLVTDKEPG